MASLGSFYAAFVADMQGFLAPMKQAQREAREFDAMLCCLQTTDVVSSHTTPLEFPLRSFLNILLTFG